MSTSEEEPSEEELREVGAGPRASKKMIVLAVVAGVIAAIVLVAASQLAERRDREGTSSSESR